MSDTATQWAATMADLDLATADFDGFEQSTLAPALAGPQPLPDQVEGEVARLHDVIQHIENRLLAMPAPDLAALRWKLEYLLDTEGGLHSEESMVQTKVDMQRLLV